MNSTLGRKLTEKSKARLLTEGLAPYILMAFVGYTISDVGIMSVRDMMLPQKAPPAKPLKPQVLNSNSKSAYQSIIGRNLFSNDGTIPEALTIKQKDGKPGAAVEADPVPSQLPLTLIGTMVLTNPAKSIANIEVKSKNMVVALMPNHDIENMASLVRVERNKAILRNTNNGRLEFIEIKNASKISFNSQSPTAPVAKGTGEVKEVAPNKYVLKRENLLKHINDLSGLLMQASTVPRRKANGDIECYVLTSFKPDSVFADLGVSQGDCIKSVNGEAIDSPAKAMEIYNALKNSPNIKLTVESDGRDVNKEYTIE